MRVRRILRARSIVLYELSIENRKPILPVKPTKSLVLDFAEKNCGGGLNLHSIHAIHSFDALYSIAETW